MTGQGIRCPSCGSTNVKQIGAHRESALGVTNGTANSEKGTTRYAYQCECGMAFTHSVKEGDAPGFGPAPL